MSDVRELWSGVAPELVVVATPNSSHAAIRQRQSSGAVRVVIDKSRYDSVVSL